MYVVVVECLMDSHPTHPHASSTHDDVPCSPTQTSTMVVGLCQDGHLGDTPEIHGLGWSDLVTLRSWTSWLETSGGGPDV